jgi:phosphatidylserine/phosphatidylglycerophosphate/cardiolipin synthase-like enzyme
VVTVNGFPMALEIQHALLRALRRGVRVRCLVGSLTPTHGGTPFRGPWSTARMGATAFVHSRIDAIVAAGGEGYQFQVPSQPGWDRRVGVVCPHVHAKLLCVDGQVCTVGSANLDITAGYWESELMLMIEDPALVGAVEAWVDRLIAGSRRFDRGDPAWQQSARRREWMQRWPGVLSI